MYRSPVEDILFSLRHVGGLDEATMLFVDYLYEVAKLGRR